MMHFYLAIISTVIVIFITVLGYFAYTYQSRHMQSDFDSKMFSLDSATKQVDVNRQNIDFIQSNLITKQEKSLNELKQKHEVSINKLSKDINDFKKSNNVENTKTVLQEWEADRIQTLEEIMSKTQGQLAEYQSSFDHVNDALKNAPMNADPNEANNINNLKGQYANVQNAYSIHGNSVDYLNQSVQDDMRHRSMYIHKTTDKMNRDLVKNSDLLDFANTVNYTYAKTSTLADFNNDFNMLQSKTANYANRDSVSTFAKDIDVKSQLAPYATKSSLKDYEPSANLDDYIPKSAMTGYALHGDLREKSTKMLLSSIFDGINKEIDSIIDFLTGLPTEYTTQQDITTLLSILDMMNATIVSIKGQCDYIKDNYVTNSAFDRVINDKNAQESLMNKTIIPNLINNIQTLSNRASLFGDTYLKMQDAIKLYAKTSDFNLLIDKIKRLPQTEDDLKAILDTHYGSINDFNAAMNKYNELPNFDASYATFDDLDATHTIVHKLHDTGQQMMDLMTGKSLNNTFEFGMGVIGKDVNAGKIGYSTLSTNALDIIGAGSGEGRTVQFYDNLNVDDTLNMKTLTLGGVTHWRVPLGPRGDKGDKGDKGDNGDKGEEGKPGKDVQDAGGSFEMKMLNPGSVVNTTQTFSAQNIAVKDNLCLNGVCINGAQLKNIITKGTS